MRALAGVASMLALSACALSSAATTPAVIAAPDAASRATLQQTVAALLGRPVMLAEDALVHATTLVVERTVARDPSGNRIEATERTGPETFRLVKRGDECLLVRDSTQTTATLPAVKCVAAP
jgi:hypothetical protein